MIDRTRMGQLHEEFLAELTGGRRTRGSGNQWRDQGDTHDNRLLVDPAFAFDGKSTRGASIPVTLDMIEKIIEQSGGERPALGLRWYGNDKLTQILADWVAISAENFGQLLAAAREAHGQGRRAALLNVDYLASVSDEDLSEAIDQMDPELKIRLLNALSPSSWPSMSLVPAPDWDPTSEEVAQFGRDLDAALKEPMVPAASGVTPWADDLALHDDVAQLIQVSGLDEDTLAGQPLHSVMQAIITQLRGPVLRNIAPTPPGTLLFSLHVPDQRQIVHQGIHVGATGARSAFKPSSVRLERGTGQESRLFIDDTWVRDVAWYLDGVIQHSAGSMR